MIRNRLKYNRIIEQMPKTGAFWCGEVFRNFYFFEEMCVFDRHYSLLSFHLSKVTSENS